MPVPKMNRGMILRLGRLLDMMYKPGELAKELSVSTETVVNSYLPAGAPVTVDSQGTWIHGTRFALWAREVLATNRRGQLVRTVTEKQAWCMRCNQVVEIANPRRHATGQRPGVGYVSGKCPLCGAKVNRFVRAARVA